MLEEESLLWLGGLIVGGVLFATVLCVCRFRLDLEVESEGQIALDAVVNVPQNNK